MIISAIANTSSARGTDLRTLGWCGLGVEIPGAGAVKRRVATVRNDKHPNRHTETTDQLMYEQVNSSAAEPDDIGSRIDPVLARSWLLVNGAHSDRFQPAVDSRA